MINPPSKACDDAREDETVTIVPEETAVVGTFLAQLRLLLGIPETVTFYNVLKTFIKLKIKLLSIFLLIFNCVENCSSLK